MFVEYIYIYIYIYEQYNPETARRNTPKLKHFVPIEKTKHLPKRNWQPWLYPIYHDKKILAFFIFNCIWSILEKKILAFFIFFI